MNHLHLNEIATRIDQAFGGEAQFPQHLLTERDFDSLQQVFGSDDYKDFLQDQINRQIIRDYLLNAVMLGFLSEDQLANIAPLLTTDSGRGGLSLHMLMHSVEEAGSLPLGGGAGGLRQLGSTPKPPTHMKIVPTS